MFALTIHPFTPQTTEIWKCYRELRNVYDPCLSVFQFFGTKGAWIIVRKENCVHKKDIFHPVPYLPRHPSPSRLNRYYRMGEYVMFWSYTYMNSQLASLFFSPAMIFMLQSSSGRVSIVRRDPTSGVSWTGRGSAASGPDYERLTYFYMATESGW